MCLPYFAQKSLAAPLLRCRPSAITALKIAGEFALVAVKGQPAPYAIALSALEAEHDRQRTERGESLGILAIEPESGDTYFGRTWPGSLHATNHLAGECDCTDWRSQSMAGRKRPYCKHLAAKWKAHHDLYAAVSGGNYRQRPDAEAIAAGELAKADLGF